MIKKLSFSILLTLVTFQAAAQKVTKVYSCGDDIGIEIENVGWYVVLESQVGEKRVDRMLSIALSLLATQASIGYTNPKAAINWCGISDAKPITVIQANRN